MYLVQCQRIATYTQLRCTAYTQFGSPGFWLIWLIRLMLIWLSLVYVACLMLTLTFSSLVHFKCLVQTLTLSNLIRLIRFDAADPANPAEI